MLDILLVNTGDKYPQIYTDNIIYMLDKTGSKYDNVHIITEEQYDGVWNKLQLFRDFKKGPYLYFDLDVCLTKNVEYLQRKQFTLLKAWWREKYHTPLNSSVMSWEGDYSFYYNIFNTNPDYYMMKYKGIDQYIYELDMSYTTYEPVCTSYNWQGFNDNWGVTIFNQAYDKMREKGPWSKYMLFE